MQSSNSPRLHKSSTCILVPIPRNHAPNSTYPLPSPHLQNHLTVRPARHETVLIIPLVPLQIKRPLPVLLLLLLSAAYPFRVRLLPCAVFVFFTNAWTIADGTLRWQAPELTGGHSGLTQQVDSDVYAFAITCVELLTKSKLQPAVADGGR